MKPDVLQTYSFFAFVFYKNPTLDHHYGRTMLRNVRDFASSSTL